MVSRSKHFLLSYRYVEGMEQKRGPVRPDHLNYLQEASSLRLGGALLNPIDTGILILECEQHIQVDNFVKGDPYYKANLITSYSIREIAPVAGSWLKPKP